MKNWDTGILVMEHNIKLHRQYFKQMTRLLGINVVYFTPQEESKSYNLHGELEAHYEGKSIDDFEKYLAEYYDKVDQGDHPDYNDIDEQGRPEMDPNIGMVVSCIYDEHPTQKTMRLLGWDAEMADTNVIMHLPYDLPRLQRGCIIAVPTGNDIPEDPDPDGSESNEREHNIRKWRFFRVLQLSTTAIYPASVSCELGPLYPDTMPRNDITDFRNTSYTVLNGEEDEYGY